MTNKNPFEKSNEIYGSRTLHREIGYYTTRLEQYEKSLQFFDSAVKNFPNDRRTLIGRSRARAKAAQIDGAMEDIDHALANDPDDLGILADKALNTYLCCEFEEGLVQNLRHLKRRTKPEVFQLGSMYCYEAIENCLGDRAGRPLRDHFRIIRKLAWKKNYAAQKPFQPTPKGKLKKKKHFLQNLQKQEVTTETVQPKKVKINLDVGIKDSLHSKKSNEEKIPPYNQPFPFKPLQRYTTNIDNYMAEKYLDIMYLDKIFLKNIDSEPGVYSPNEKGTKKIRQIAKSCFKTVASKQELLRTRRPFYFIKYQEGRISSTLKRRQEIELQHQQKVTKHEADNLLEKMLKALDEKRLKDCLNISEKLRRYCDSKSKKILPTKAEYVNAINKTVCKAFYDVHRVNKDHGRYEQNKRIYCLLGVPLSREPSTDSVIVQFKNVFMDYKKQINEFKTRLENATVPEDICWFYHELGRYHLNLKNYELSRLYAKKCIQEATVINNDMWIFNSAMLMCKSDLQQQNKNDAKGDLMQALKSVTKLKDDDKIAYVNQCVEVMEDVQFDDIFGEKELSKREHKIVEMMAGTHLKEEMSHLFRKMSAMPVARRMTVIPGVKLDDHGSKKTSGRAPSIMPKQRDDENYKDLKHAKSDKDLMNIIELHL